MKSKIQSKVQRSRSDGYSAGYSAGMSDGMSNAINKEKDCICKNWSPVEDYTVIRKEYLIHLLKTSSKLVKGI